MAKRKYKNNSVRKLTTGDYILDAVIVIIMLLNIFLVLYPFINSIAISLNDADDTTRGGIGLWPRVFTTRNYELVFQNPKIYKAYGITILRSVIGLFTGLYFTGALAFGLAHKQLRGRKIYIFLALIPMFFAGGLMPTYFLYLKIGLLDNFWVYILPSLVNLWNMMLMRNYFQGIPEALEESARIDGAHYIRILFSIIIPISTPIIATIALYILVFHWNSWFDAAIFIDNQDLKPVQTVLASIISEAKFAESLVSQSGGAVVDMGNIAKGRRVNVRSITMATMIVTIIPIIMIYPFIQKYFNKGIMVGSIKG